jgi:hypothetical protein
MYDKVFKPLTSRKYPVVSINFVSDFKLRDVFQEHNRGIKQDLPVFRIKKILCTLFRTMFPASCFLRLVHIFITGIL